MCEKQSKYVFSEGLIRHIHVFKKQDRGQSLVELAIIMPVFILILFGLIQFGNIRYAEILMHMAARHGARVESLDGNGKAAVGEYLSKYSCIDMKNVSISISKRFMVHVTVVDVRIVYRMQLMSVFRKVFPKNFQIQASYTF
jgi:hypothetical protein